MNKMIKTASNPFKHYRLIIEFTNAHFMLAWCFVFEENLIYRNNHCLFQYVCITLKLNRVSCISDNQKMLNTFPTSLFQMSKFTFDGFFLQHLFFQFAISRKGPSLSLNRSCLGGREDVLGQTNNRLLKGSTHIDKTYHLNNLFIRLLL